ncbi:MAG: phosphoribosylformylglycinamidine synthase, partial [Firmicutes bacterium]|nr:phosphoribosylformylglycinamidine synthase [Bacillota bacterium]
MVFRVYSEKKREFAHEAKALLLEANKLLGIEGLKDVRVINRYDAERIRPELFEYAKTAVFSEPQVDICTEEPDLEGAKVFAVEFLPGQFDQRADSAAQCIQLISQEERPLVRSAKVYALYGDLSQQDIAEIKKYVINPVEAREASLDIPDTLEMTYAVPERVAVLEGFLDLDEQGLADFIKANGLAMDRADIKFCQEYFKTEGRCPTITEIKVIDTYWSDHCRHTTFGTIIDSVTFEDELLQDTWEDYLSVRK